MFMLDSAPDLPEPGSAASLEPWNPLAPYEPQARAFLRAAKAANTLRAYRADWNHFTRWCEALGQTSLPAIPETVAFYLTALAGSHKPATLVRRLPAIPKAHQAAGASVPRFHSARGGERDPERHQKDGR